MTNLDFMVPMDSSDTEHAVLLVARALLQGVDVRLPDSAYVSITDEGEDWGVVLMEEDIETALYVDTAIPASVVRHADRITLLGAVGSVLANLYLAAIEES